MVPACPMPCSTMPSGVNLDLDGTGTLAISQWTSYTRRGRNDQRRRSDVRRATEYLECEFLYQRRASVSLPIVTSMTTTPGVEPIWQITGAGTTLTMGSLAMLSADPTRVTYGSEFAIDAMAGGHLSPPALTHVAGHVQFESDGAGSQVDVHALSSYVGGTQQFAAFLQATHSGTISRVRRSLPPTRLT